MSDFETLIQSRLLKLHLTVLTGVRIYTTSNHHPLTIDIHCTKLSLKMVCLCFHNFEYFRSHSTVGRRCFGSTKMCPHPRSQRNPQNIHLLQKFWRWLVLQLWFLPVLYTFFIPHHVFFPNGLARHVFSGSEVQWWWSSRTNVPHPDAPRNLFGSEVLDEHLKGSCITW